jgi:SAM-dependent methyltransferase
VLELGPLEGGHSAMLHAAGASVLAIESNTNAFLKCLITKNLLALDRCQFELGDFLPYLEVTDRRFDFVLASGVLYHSPQPITLLESIARVTDRMAVWTHYFDEAVLSQAAFRRVFAPTSDMVGWRGRSIELRRHAYLESLDWSGFCGGSQETTLWMSRQSLLDVLAELGFNDVRTLFDDPQHPYGPCIMIFASR